MARRRTRGHRRRHHKTRRGKGKFITKVKNFAKRLLKSNVGGYALDYLQKQRNA